MKSPRLVAIAVFALAAILSRFVPHPPNLTAVGSLALFGGCYLAERRLSYVALFLTMFISDLILGMHSLMPVVYLCFGVTIWLGHRFCQDKQLSRIPACLFASSVIFFVVTNFGVWLSGYYPMTLDGLTQCYVAAIPFFQNQIVGDAFYGLVMFGGFFCIENIFPALQSHQSRS